MMSGKTSNSITVSQLALAIVATAVGSQLIISSKNLLKAAGQAAWISMIIGGIVFGSIAVMMVKIAKTYPNKTFIEYIPKIWGGFLGRLFILYFYLIFLGQTCMILQGFGKLIKFIMFDKTPQRAIMASILFVCVYCALKKFNIIIKVLSILTFLTTPIIVIWLLAMQNFDVELLLPIFPLSFQKLTQGVMISWSIFNGYEIIMLLFPLVKNKPAGMSPEKGIIWAFCIMTLFFTMVVAIITGVLGAEQAKLFTVPAITVIKGVELPGTFAERLENYLMIFWIPLVFETVSIFVFTLAKILQRQLGLLDHRPAVVLQIPIIYFVANLMSRIEWYEAVGKGLIYMGLLFSLLVIPLTFIMIKWRKRSEGEVYEQ